MATKLPIQINIEIDDWHDGSFTDRVIEKIVANIQGDIQKQVHDRARKVIDDTMKEQAENAVIEYLRNYIAVTNTYGEKTGKTCTLTELIVEKFSKYMNEFVNKQGNPDTYNRDNIKRIDWLVGKICTEGVEKIVKDAIMDARKRGEAAIQQTIAELMVKHVGVTKES